MGGLVVAVRKPGDRVPIELLAEEKLHPFVLLFRQAFHGSMIERRVVLRLIICSGEALPLSSRNALEPRINSEMVNLYGLTETTVDVTFRVYINGCGTRLAPIGRPIANTRDLFAGSLIYSLFPSGSLGSCTPAVTGWPGVLQEARADGGEFIPNPFQRQQERAAL